MSVFLDAIKLLEKRGWTQMWPHGGTCIGLAVCTARGRTMASSSDSTERDPVQVLATAVGLPHTAAALMEWNDDPSTTYEDVILALKRAHEAWEADACDHRYETDEDERGVFEQCQSCGSTRSVR